LGDEGVLWCDSLVMLYIDAHWATSLFWLRLSLRLLLSLNLPT